VEPEPTSRDSPTRPVRESAGGLAERGRVQPLCHTPSCRRVTRRHPPTPACPEGEGARRLVAGTWVTPASRSQGVRTIPTGAARGCRPPARTGAPPPAAAGVRGGLERRTLSRQPKRGPPDRPLPAPAIDGCAGMARAARVSSGHDSLSPAPGAAPGWCRHHRPRRCGRHMPGNRFSSAIPERQGGVFRCRDKPFWEGMALMYSSTGRVDGTGAGVRTAVVVNRSPPCPRLNSFSHQNRTGAGDISDVRTRWARCVTPTGGGCRDARARERPGPTALPGRAGDRAGARGGHRWSPRPPARPVRAGWTGGRPVPRRPVTAEVAVRSPRPP